MHFSRRWMIWNTAISQVSKIAQNLEGGSVCCTVLCHSPALLDYLLKWIPVVAVEAFFGGIQIILITPECHKNPKCQISATKNSRKIKIGSCPPNNLLLSTSFSVWALKDICAAVKEIDSLHLQHTLPKKQKTTKKKKVSGWTTFNVSAARRAAAAATYLRWACSTLAPLWRMQ